jgi:hypothetical protein
MEERISADISDVSVVEGHLGLVKLNENWI